VAGGTAEIVGARSVVGNTLKITEKSIFREKGNQVVSATENLDLKCLVTIVEESQDARVVELASLNF
jgi:hypothetical protein